jgi:hypothetical protein
MGRILKREQGIHNPPGFIKLKIIEFVYDNVNGVPTPVIKDYLRAKYQVTEPKGIRDHLNDLEEKHYIQVKHKPGLDSIWSPPDTLDHLPALLVDREIWGVLRVDKKPVADVVDWMKCNCDSVVKLFNTQFFNKSVKPSLIQRFCSSPPFLDESNKKFSMDLKNVPKSEDDEKELRELYNRALSESPTVMIHMYIPSPLIWAGLFAIQMNPKIYAQNAEIIFQEHPDQYPFTADQLNEIRMQVQSWKEIGSVSGDMFTSIEAFGLASVYLGMSIDQIQFPHLSEKINPILSDLGANATLGKYITSPFFFVEFMKFLITLGAVWSAFSVEK